MARYYRAGAVAAGAIVSLGAIVGVPALTKQVEEPVARYTMDAATVSGMGAMGSGMGAAMKMMAGGGGSSVAHQLTLHLGSTRAPSGAPAADHFMPEGAKLGTSVPLVSPTKAAPQNDPGGMPYSTGEMPKGRLLIYWGCGEHAAPGQPVVIDFAKLAKGQVPANLYGPAMAIAEAWEVTQANSRTYGEWPNARDNKALSARSSLLGAHRIAGSYSPEIAFTLDTDFMAPVALKNRKLASGAYGLDWGALGGATGYYAFGMGSGGGKSSDMVWWSSARQQQAFGGAMMGYLTPSAAADMVKAGTLMAPSQTSCAVPAEAVTASGGTMMTQFHAFGPERDFASPARPADPKVAWKPDWIARVRFKSSTMAMLGTDFSGADGAPVEEGAEAPATKPKCKGLAGIAKRAAGLCI